MDTKRPKTLTEAYPQLAAPFPSALVRWRAVEVDEQNGQALVVPYVEAAAVMDRLDQVVGPEGWSYDFELLPDGTVKGKLTVLGITKCNRGAVVGDNISAADKVKGDASDGLKRAAVLFGIGRYLARVGPVRVPYDPARRAFEPPQLPDWALPEDERGRAKPHGAAGAKAPETGEGASGPRQEEAADAPPTARDFWSLANEALQQGVPNGEIQAIARGANGDWARAMDQLRQAMEANQPDWLPELVKGSAEDLEELFG